MESNNKKEFDIFLSYSSKDRPKIARLAEIFTARGYSVWWDTYISHGETWDEYIDKNLKLSRIVVVCWSENAIQSRWVRTEAHEGLKKNLLFPLRLDGVDPPLAFRLIQTANLSDWDGQSDLSNHKEFNKLLRSTRSALDGLGAKVVQQPVVQKQAKPQRTSTATSSDISEKEIKKPNNLLKIGAGALLLLILGTAAFYFMDRSSNPPKTEVGKKKNPTTEVPAREVTKVPEKKITDKVVTGNNAKQIDVTAWRKASKLNTAAAYENYKRENPQGKYVADADEKIKSIRSAASRDRRYDQLVIEAGKKFRRGDYETALKGYLQAAKIKTPNEGLEKLITDCKTKLEEQAWEQAKKANTIEAYEKFQKLFPKSKRSRESEKRIRLLDLG